jgi:hypothetical protein
MNYIKLNLSDSELDFGSKLQRFIFRCLNIYKDNYMFIDINLLNKWKDELFVNMKIKIDININSNILELICDDKNDIFKFQIDFKKSIYDCVSLIANDEKQDNINIFTLRYEL